MDDVSKSVYHESPLGYDNVDWFDEKTIILENKQAFYFKRTNKDIIMTEKDKEHFKKTFEFVRKIMNLMKLKIIFIWQVNTENLLITVLILMSLRNKVIASHFHFTILGNMNVTYSSRN